MRLALPSIFVFTLLLAAASILPSSSVAAPDDGTGAVTVAGETFSVGPAKVSSEITVESKTIDGEAVEIVHLPDNESFTISAGIDAQALRASGLTDLQIAEIREDSREALELTMRGVLSPDFGGALVVGENGDAAAIQIKENGVNEKPVNLFKKLFAYNHSVYKAAPAGLSKLAHLKRFAQMVWQFVFIETIHAGIEYYKGFRGAVPRFNEFGIALDFKIEPQVFIAKFNPTAKIKSLSRNYAFFFEISYSRLHHRVMLTTRFRREKGAGGLGLPALKVEAKIFETDGFQQPFKGKAWYPISPPLVSFVLDSSEHYFAQGVTIGVNSGDLVPGSTLTNTFTTFVQNQGSLSVSEVPTRTAQALTQAARLLLPARPAACQAIFQ